MKKKSTSKSAFFNLRVLLASVLFLAGVFFALAGAGLYLGSSKAQAQPGPGSVAPAANSANGPDVVQLVGPVRLDQDLRSLPYIPPTPQILKEWPTLHSFPLSGGPARSETSAFPWSQSVLEKIFRPVPTMPPPLLTFDGINRVEARTTTPPDTNGDVGPNHYVQSVNDSYRVFDKNGTQLTGLITFNMFFASLTGTPCGAGQNEGDPFVFYDQLADRWVITDFAHPRSSRGWGPGPFYQCIGVSQSGDPVAGGWFLYALQTDPGNPTWVGDYPKFALWNNPQPGGAYELTVILLSDRTPFNGIRVFALDRGSMLSGGHANAIAFTVPPAGAGADVADAALVPAGFRTGNPPPGDRDEFLLGVDSPGPGVPLTQVKGWLFHVDFAVPANSTLGVGLNHAPNALIRVNRFIDAFTNTTATGGLLVPQQGTTQKLDTMGDKIMTPVVYQNRSGTESLWADHTVMLNYPNGPTAIRWYQFDVTGGNFPATPVQQQDWSNGNDGLWRWMPSIAVDAHENVAIGYSASSPNMFPGIRYAGRLATDPLNDLGQGEAIMINGGGSQNDRGGRWGDYTMTTIDPADGLSFWHTNQYYQMTATQNWSTRVGKFEIESQPSPTPRPRPTPEPRPTPP